MDPFAELDAAIEAEADFDRGGSEAYDQFREQYQAEFEAYRRQLLAEFEQFRRIHDEEAQRLERRLEEVWDEPRFSTPHVWVEYSDSLRTRHEVDFEHERMSLSLTGRDAIDDAELRERLSALVATTRAQAFANDALAQAVEQRSVAELELIETDEVTPDPALYTFLTGEEEIDTARLDAIVSAMMATHDVRRETNGRGEEVLSVDIALAAVVDSVAVEDSTDSGVTDEPAAGPGPAAESPPPETTAWPAGYQPPAQARLPARARGFLEPVLEFAEREEVEPAMVFAIMETESSFNPMARSHVPAYGLMQIVPESAGQDATAKLFGLPRILSPSYLYNSRNNIEIGIAYFNLLYYRYLRSIDDPRSRLYCAVAAYNTGAGNVARAFVGRPHIRPAVERINAMTPEEVYAYLIEHLPYQETRDYLQRVFSRVDRYRS